MRYSHKAIAIEDKSSIGDARRAAVQMAQSLGFNEDRRSDIAIVSTEAATNVLLHAAKGEFLICPFVERETSWLDMFALDSGPGIADVGRAMEDGVSSTGTAGQGLGAIDRLSDDSSLYTTPGKGVASWFRFRNGEIHPGMSNGLLNVPIHGETVCGDSYFIHVEPSRSLYMVVDGLGHGAGAHEAASEAVATAGQFRSESASEILVHAHDALKKTRGAAMSVAIVNHERLVLTYAGIGNVAAALLNGTSYRNLVSQNGTLGAAFPRVAMEYTFPIAKETLLLMYTDGLNSKTSLTNYPGLQNRHPALMAGVLYRDFSRRRDDASILIAPVGGTRS